MLALYFDGALELREVEPPVQGAGEAVVAVRKAGICNTDLEVVRGYRGYVGVLGHEMVGAVERASDPTWIGRRVAVEINVGCGRCEWCAAGDRNHCGSREVMGIVGRPGCFATHVAMPVENLHPVPDSVSDDAAIFIEPLAAAFEIVEQVEIGANDTVAVLGDGKLGLLAAMVLRREGHATTVIGKHPDKLAIATSIGADVRLAADDAPRGFDVVVEATGSNSGLARALELVRPRGVVVLKSTFFGPTTAELSRIVIDEIRVVGSRCGPFSRAIEALADGSIDPTPLLRGTYRLSRAVEAMHAAHAPGTLKIAIEP